jgi:CheY-like chemotaxis protein
MDALPRSFTILMADDDDEDCLLVRDALALNVIPHDLRTVPDGVELLDYLDRRGKYEDRRQSPRPDLILLDLNMPRKDGREALGELKADRRWRQIPVVVLTTSTSDDDISFSYRSGASSYIAKPSTYQAWVELVGTLHKYWFELARLPT